jgi:hypothetical protein
MTMRLLSMAAGTIGYRRATLHQYPLSDWIICRGLRFLSLDQFAGDEPQIDCIDDRAHGGAAQPP